MAEDSEVPKMWAYEVSKGGVKYELILPPECTSLKKRLFPVTRPKTPSLVEIKRKQEEAENRRIYLRKNRNYSMQLNNIAKVREARVESIADFISAKEGEVDQKLQNSGKKREHKPLHVYTLSNQSRPHTAPAKGRFMFEGKSLEDHLIIQQKLLDDLNTQANDLADAVQDLMLKEI